MSREEDVEYLEMKMSSEMWDVSTVTPESPPNRQVRLPYLFPGLGLRLVVGAGLVALGLQNKVCHFWNDYDCNVTNIFFREHRL